MPLLPAIESEEQWDAVIGDESLLRPGVDEILRRHGLGDRDVVQFDEGSVPVYAVGEQHVLKLYGPTLDGDEDGSGADVEIRTLQAIHGRLPVPTPEVVGTGVLDGWQYLVMSRLHGRSLVDVWSTASRDVRMSLATQLGEALAALHAVPVEALELPPSGGWGAFVTRQRQRAVARQRSRGLDDVWLDQIPEFLDGVDVVHDGVALLHTEVMNEHLLVQPDGDSWRLSGLIDVEPAMKGAPEYEFAAVGIFVTGGDSAALRRVLSSYGYADAELDHEMSRRLLAWTVLHTYSNLPWYFRQVPGQPDKPTFDALAAHWFGLG